MNDNASDLNKATENDVCRFANTRDVQDALGWLKRTDASVHLIGIGGIGMAGLAYLLHQAGIAVSGSDLCENSLTAWLKAEGIRVERGHSMEYVGDDVKWCIRSTAIRDDHPEVKACSDRGVAVFVRGAVLAAYVQGRPSIAVSGTHGKTTTTAMIAHVLRESGRDSGYFVGGEQRGMRVAESGLDWFVAEADESDGTVALYHPEISLITNIEYDHMEHFGCPERLEACFTRFMDQTRRTICYCGDDEAAARLALRRTNTVSYGLTLSADIQGKMVCEEPTRTVFRLTEYGADRGEVTLPLHGIHNVYNALGAYSVTRQCRVSFDTYCTALASFRSVGRRFEYCGQVNGIPVYSDYAHHPTEIRAAYQMACQLNVEKVTVIFQPHRYTRTKALKKDFVNALQAMGEVILCPVYAASEEKLAGGTSDDLFQALQAAGATHVRKASSLDEAWVFAKEQAGGNDLILIVGAGDVDSLARRDDVLKQNDDRSV